MEVIVRVILNKYGLFLLFIQLLCTPLYADRLPNLLGGGGSQYSSVKNHRLIRQNGLRTGQYTGQHHFVGLWLDGAYSQLRSPLTICNNTPGGYAVGGGVAYEFQDRFFMLQTGIGLRWQDVQNSVADTAFTIYNVHDSWTGQYDDYVYDMKVYFYRRTDYSRNFYLQLPILFGANYLGMYFLAGGKLQLAVAGNTHIEAVGSTMGVYDQFLGEFREMDNHGLRKDVPIVRDNDRLHLKCDLLLSGEIGYEWTSKEHKGYRIEAVTAWRYRIAAFAEWSVLNINPNAQQPLCDVPMDTKWDFCTYDFNHVYASQPAYGCAIRNLFVGLKLTVLIGRQGKEECVICDYYRDERDPGAKEPNVSPINPWHKRNTK